MDWLCAAAVIINSIELLVLIGFYVPLVRVVPFASLGAGVDLSRFADSFVSDLLHTNPTYNTLLTSLVGLHLGVCVMFVVRLNLPLQRPLMVTELAFLLLAWLGWTVLNSFYLDAQGHMMVGHMVGAGMFIFSSSLYFGCMLWNVAMVGNGPWLPTESCLFFVVAFCFFVSVGAGLVFVASVFDRRIPLPWIFEHVSFIMFVGANLLLFITDGLFGERRRERQGAFSGVRITSL